MPRQRKRVWRYAVLFRHVLLFSVLLTLALAVAQPVWAATSARVRTSEKGGTSSSLARKKHNTAAAPPFSERGKALVSLVEHRHGIEEETPRYSLRVEYPSFGVSAVDEEIALWARRQVDTFTRGLEEIPGNDPSHFTLAISYQYIQASVNCASILFSISTETGGPQPDQGMATFTYNMHSGKVLEYNDIFSSPQNLLPFLSSYSLSALSRQPWARDHLTRTQTGTSPDALNFTFFAIVPQGLAVYFPPGQAGPLSEGTLSVTVPLKELQSFQPQLSFWGQAAAPPKPAGRL